MPLLFLIKQLCMPPGVLFILLILSWWLRKRAPRIAACCFFCGAGGLWVMSLPVTVEWAARQIETEPALSTEQVAQLAQLADAIVVLGAGRDQGDAAWTEDQPSALAIERLRYAARLARASGLPVLISGGLHFGKPPSEAAIMADVLDEDFSVATRWQESQSRTTWENAQFSREILAAEKINRVVVVTQAFHMARARWSFQQQGFAVVPAPVGSLAKLDARPDAGWLPDGKAFMQSTWLINEAIGHMAYRLFY
ncbi:YdcF family protein [Pseudomonas sp. S9]|uniref:YdcF family protein n=1 Tax=Pseudomonas sp. S9 TaxID=686578 RepID=UPI0002557422|nr:YdcF family protein [Pseudomonas sp. S9]